MTGGRAHGARHEKRDAVPHVVFVAVILLAQHARGIGSRVFTGMTRQRARAAHAQASRDAP